MIARVFIFSQLKYTVRGSISFVNLCRKSLNSVLSKQLILRYFDLFSFSFKLWPVTRASQILPQTRAWKIQIFPQVKFIRLSILFIYLSIYLALFKFICVRIRY